MTHDIDKGGADPVQTGTPRTILILEDSQERIAAFRRVIANLAPSCAVRVWRNAHRMMEECEAYFAEAVLISLDHDLNETDGDTADAGTGLLVAQYLGDRLPVCPVLIHSSNTDRVWSMHNELRFAGWTVDRVGPIGDDWITSLWLPRARDLIAACPNVWTHSLPVDHSLRLERMKCSLEGLAIGDGLGEMLAYRAESAPQWFASEHLPAGPWIHTDDTEMAMSIAGVLRSHGMLHQDALAKRFARRFERDPDRGYGKMTRIQMREIIAGQDWRRTAANAFGGQGSLGNGSAMRVAPLGAYFADDLDRCVSQAEASSTVTHTHPEAIAGAIAVAVAAAVAWQVRQQPEPERTAALFREVLRLTPESRVRRGLLLAGSAAFDSPLPSVVKALGNGALVTAPDTVPLCIWMAARHLQDYPTAIAQTISAGGDCDTNAAIVGGIVATVVGEEGIPRAWRQAKEPILI